MMRASRWRVLVGATALGLVAVIAVQLYPSERDHEAAASVQLLTADRSPETTIHLTSVEMRRAATLSDLTARAAARTPFEVVITANANSDGRARALVGDAAERAEAALTSGARATPEVIAQAGDDVGAAESVLAAAQTALSAVDAQIAAFRADKGTEDPSAQLAQIDRQLAELQDSKDAAIVAGQDTTQLDAQIADAQQQRFAMDSAAKQFAELQERRATEVGDVERASGAVDRARARLARYQAGATGSVAVAPIRTQTIVSERGFGPDVTIVVLVTLAAVLCVLALATRPRPEVALDLTPPEPPPDPAPEREAEPEPAPVDVSHADADTDMPPRAMRQFKTVKLRSPGPQ